MFKGKLSILKNSAYLIILGLHTFLYAYFLYYSWFNYVIFILSLTSLIGLISLAFYSFLASKPYFYHFYIGIIISSIPLAFVIIYSAFLIVPEVVILLILFFRGTDDSEKYIHTRINKKANLFQHDPATSSRYKYSAPGPANLAVQMDIVWNPDGTIPLERETKMAEKRKINFKTQVIVFIIASVFFVCSVISVSNYFSRNF